MNPTSQSISAQSSSGEQKSRRRTKQKNERIPMTLRKRIFNLTLPLALTVSLDIKQVWNAKPFHLKYSFIVSRRNSDSVLKLPELERKRKPLQKKQYMVKINLRRQSTGMAYNLRLVLI
ncbi:hypothetical protein PHYBLDRAFT_168716 [Phycomyces blakesleeanus NRRL 1555(-)]|uniref:Uncharacterized protein n=1 Tax=Phycomyces blakesleeanus (strain ATCC 8743b / DSM 1359 / FGSC 10004 / NBRC 33097 / NRRL 1555) TaxID=763407 RepID=A0A162NDP0_PHYB8|nr:hypothetical protein PHYBLDRAFT_168716 [Phycomyces blakesleeanus NRRL 1555(-)]OAD73358.1 hypothetical protein PHYBLDRAFT_168716 [Phycomyces blakesleeanus NRRL 1555(-)]|eukprot:XP_018291398.1 hypothetical protein PHYBLDRAFT_168716 [Phycomyces blakesleeanus NRRL 1555(-)]